MPRRPIVILRWRKLPPYFSALALTAGPRSIVRIDTTSTATITPIVTANLRPYRYNVRPAETTPARIRWRRLGSCGVTSVIRIELFHGQQHGPGVDRLPFLHGHVTHAAITSRAQFVFHLHRFNDDEALPGGHGI